MKRIATFAFATFTTLIMASCASTSDSGSGGQYPVLKVLSDKPYVWDDSISEALNVARMAQPAGVGNGMKDFADGTHANTGRIGAGMRTFDAGIGLLSQGIFGVIAHESLSQGVNRQLDWKPSIVQLVDAKKVTSDNGLISFDKIAGIVSDSVKGSVEKGHPGISWGPDLIPKDQRISNLSIAINDMVECKKAFDFISINKEHKGYIDQPYSKFFINGGNVSEKHCIISLNISIAGVKKSGELIIVSEIISGHYFNDSIVKNHTGYVIVPDIYFIRASDSPKDIAVTTNYAFVSSKGEKLLFESK
ncbi:hypothetical protein [Alishewanella tabrizica]|uniref:Lipoprotein n=1 Tax=Alishewanella tabrizica TaxID=671278 RepID=A0ABQ2WUR1_9ALTE|nr:hypothetical protein [Alishewanella tabrizica]GGW73965.1 hypothetical protein GCM10008111_32260 [Alishewanella tabrizica]